ncbi:MAG TPA: hypothetical protein VKB86_03620 [Pyrinomonadaceae bacterium]|nr:hypothetical protein [Pyrinomonadaceae bacterium]
MSEDTTQDMNGSQSFEERVMAALTTIDNRLTSLEEKVDRRLMETRPIWEAMQSQLERLERKFDRLSEKFDLLISDLYDIRGDIRSLSKRVAELEDTRHDKQPQE